MTLPIFPISPVWADLDILGDWRSKSIQYDSGARQGATPRTRPLDIYTLNGRNFNEQKHASLDSFRNSLSGETDPFLFKNPYKYRAEAVTQPTSTNMNSGDGFYFVGPDGWRVIPDSAAIWVEETATGSRSNGSYFVMSQDNGFATLLVTPGAAWTSSFEYFRKVAFKQAFSFRSVRWNQFSAANIIIEELIPEI